MSKQTFRTAVFDWLSEATATATSQSLHFSTRPEWVRRSHGSFGTEDRTRAYWNSSFLDAIRNLPTWERLSEAATTWPALADHLSHNCGCSVSFGTTHSDLGLLMAPFLPAPAFEAQHLHPAAPARAWIDSTFESFSRFIESDAMRFRFVAVIAGLAVPSNALPLTLSDDGIVLERLSLEMSTLFGEAGMIRGHVAMGRHGPYDNPHQPWLALRWSRAFPKVNRDCSARELEIATTAERTETHSIRQAFLGALVLVRFSRAHFGSTLRVQEDWDVGGHSFALNEKVPDVRAVPSAETLKTEEIEELKGLFERLRTLPDQDAASIAVRRLMLASEAQRDEDRLLDDMIAAEAIMGDASEIAYKLSLRCAFLLEPADPSRRRAVFDDMQQAYRVRSKLVHGSRRPEKSMILSGVKAQMPEFVRAIENHIRRAVKFVLQLGRTPDWNDLIVGAGGEEYI